MARGTNFDAKGSFAVVATHVRGRAGGHHLLPWRQVDAAKFYWLSRPERSEEALQVCRPELHEFYLTLHSRFHRQDIHERIEICQRGGILEQREACRDFEELGSTLIQYFSATLREQLVLTLRSWSGLC